MLECSPCLMKPCLTFLTHTTHTSGETSCGKVPQELRNNSGRTHPGGWRGLLDSIGPEQTNTTGGEMRATVWASAAYPVGPAKIFRHARNEVEFANMPCSRSSYDDGRRLTRTNHGRLGREIDKQGFALRQVRGRPREPGREHMNIRADDRPALDPETVIESERLWLRAMRDDDVDAL